MIARSIPSQPSPPSKPTRRLYLKAKQLPRIASTDDVLTIEQKSKQLLDEMIDRSDRTLRVMRARFGETVDTEENQHETLLEFMAKRKKQRHDQDDQDVIYEKQKIITNRSLLIKFANKIRPKNASLNKRQRLNLRVLSNKVLNPLKSDSLLVLDRLIQQKNVDPVKQGYYQMLDSQLGEKIRRRVRRDIDLGITKSSRRAMTVQGTRSLITL